MEQENQAPVTVVIGKQYGDEGKGKIVNAISPDYDIVARPSGGHNAGHVSETLDGHKMVNHILPSGSSPHHQLLIGAGTAFCPKALIVDINNNSFLPNLTERIFVAEEAPVVIRIAQVIELFLELHRQRQSGKAGMIQTTKQGMGPTYGLLAQRDALRVIDLKDPKSFFKKEKELTEFYLKNMAQDKETMQYAQETIFTKESEEKWKEAVYFIADGKVNIVNCAYFMDSAIKQGKKILAEGAQSVLLDGLLGTYPFVTSSRTTAGGVCTGLGIAPRHIGRVIGVAKAYNTRVGGGPFLTEALGEEGEKLRKDGNEYGSTTGRPRRCGWLSIPELKYAAMVGGVTELAITKVDVLDGYESFPCATAYKSKREGNNQEVLYTPALSDELKPHYAMIKGWKDSKSANVQADLPKELKDFITMIENETSLPVTWITNGAGAKKIIECEAVTA